MLFLSEQEMGSPSPSEDVMDANRKMRMRFTKAAIIRCRIVFYRTA